MVPAHTSLRFQTGTFWLRMYLQGRLLPSGLQGAIIEHMGPSRTSSMNLTRRNLMMLEVVEALKRGEGTRAGVPKQAVGGELGAGANAGSQHLST